MIIALIAAFFLLLLIVILALQNLAVVELKFFAWSFEMTVAALVFYVSVAAGGIVALLAVPKLVSKHFKARRLSSELKRFQKRTERLEGQGSKGDR